MKRFFIPALVGLSVLSSGVSVCQADDVQVYVGGVVSGLAFGAVFGDGYPGGYYPVPYNNYGNFNTMAYGRYPYPGYDDPTRYRPVCQRYLVEVEDPYAGTVVIEKSKCSMEYVQ